MDPALMRERELFKKKSITTLPVEKRKRESDEKSNEERKKPKTEAKVSSLSSYKMINAPSSDYKFSILTRIVKYMRSRHKEGEDHPLSLDEILDETNQMYVTTKVKQWLETEALLNNPKIEVVGDKKFIFKPPFKLKDKKSLLKLLRNYDQKGLGGIMLEDVEESLPNCEKILKQLQNDVIIICRSDKKKIIFYKDRSVVLDIDEEFQKLWRAVNVDNLDDAKIEEYLEKNGIKSVHNYRIKKLTTLPKRKAANRLKRSNKPRDNEHIAHVLKNYDVTT